MNCHEAEILLLAFLGSELSPEDKKELEEHLCACHHCRCELKSLKSFEVVFSRVETLSPPAKVNEQLLAVASAPTVVAAPFRRRTSWMRYASLGAAATIMISVSVWWNVSGPTAPVDEGHNGFVEKPAKSTPVARITPTIDTANMVDVRDLQVMLNKAIGAPRVSPLRNSGLVPVSSQEMPVREKVKSNK